MTQHIPLEQMIAAIQVDAGYQQDKDKSIIRRWVHEALQEIGQGRVVVKRRISQIQNLRIKLPNDLIAIQQILLHGDNNTCVEAYLENNIYTNSRSRKTNDRHKAMKQLDCLVFSDSISPDFTKVELIYQGVPTDDKDNVLIPTSLREAVNHYARWKMLSRKRMQFSATTASKLNPVAQSELEAAQRDWDQFKGIAVSRLKSPENAQQATSIASDFFYNRPTDRIVDLTGYWGGYFGIY